MRKVCLIKWPDVDELAKTLSSAAMTSLDSSFCTTPFGVKFGETHCSSKQSSKSELTLLSSKEYICPSTTVLYKGGSCGSGLERVGGSNPAPSSVLGQDS